MDRLTNKTILITGAASGKLKLTFNHPVKELVWVAQNSTVAEDAEYSNDVVVTGATGAGSSALAKCERCMMPKIEAWLATYE